MRSQVALTRDFQEHNIRVGDVATLIDRVPHPQSGEPGCVLEVFNALGDSIAVVVVPESAIGPLRADEVFSVRTLTKAATIDSALLTPQAVADKVRPYVASRYVGDISLTLDESRIRLQNDYWRIPIRPFRWPKKVFAYYEELAELEEEVQEKEGIKVTMVSGDPMTEDEE